MSRRKVGRVSLEERVGQWLYRGLAWWMRNLIPRALGSSGPLQGHRTEPYQPAIPLHRDPICGIYVSPKVSFPLQQPGQFLHFCSAECRSRYRGSCRQAASA
jgi:YHS domain-containing protein